MILKTFLAVVALFGGIAFGQTYSITGEVVRPGIYPLPSKTSVLQALALAEGLTRQADARSAVIVREQQQIPIDLRSLMLGTK